MSVFDRFLNTLKNRGDEARNVVVNGNWIPLVDPKNPVDWSGLGKTIAGSIIGGFVIGVQYSIDAVVSPITGLLQGGRQFLFDPKIVFRFPGGYRTLESRTGLIPQIEDGLLGVIDAVWEPLTGLGWLAFPATVVVLLLSLYPVVWALGYIEKEVV